MAKAQGGLIPVLGGKEVTNYIYMGAQQEVYRCERESMCFCELVFEGC